MSYVILVFGFGNADDLSFYKCVQRTFTRLSWTFLFLSLLPRHRRHNLCKYKSHRLMYITYERNQREAYISGITAGIGIRTPFSTTKVPKFRPTWLVRISDMQLVPGSAVVDHYWALSYSWGQSGNIIHNGDEKFERVDEGKHIIVSKRKILSWKPKRKVTFERLIQRISKDFGIRYIWYDQMCIEQDDRDSKANEIRKMHLIYKFARCTLALVPELSFTGDKDHDGNDITNIDIIIDSQWSKRMWTLEEAYMSKNIVFVGRNVHLWSNDVKTYYQGRASTFIKNMHDSRKHSWNASTALWYARLRTSSKTHDRIFALANIFPELKNGITFSYDQPVRDLMIQFYGLLAQTDYSILEFGHRSPPSGDHKMPALGEKESTILPSWTGMHGVHIPQNGISDAHKKSSAHCSVTGECMSLTSEFIHVRIKVATVAETSFLFPSIEGHYSKEGLPMFPLLDKNRNAVDLHAKGSDFPIRTNKFQNMYTRASKSYSLKGTHILPLKEENGIIINTLSESTFVGGILSLTEDPSECIILYGIPLGTFILPNYSIKTICYPIIRKDNGYYRSIGTCFVFSDIDLCSMVQPKLTFFIR
ncbi:hypothetical protein BJV82DRAFT_612683 [Fennellomyces sp. T-0311]|nr:hypothetical protein BJV82DRAFT_612683 [Fennellomyces sp. T-0311]